MKFLAPLPWRVGTTEEAQGLGFWTDAIVIIDAEEGIVAVLTRGYEGDDEGGLPSWTNARMIVESVNKANGHSVPTVSGES